MHVGWQLLAIDGLGCGGQALRHELTPEGALSSGTAGRPEPCVWTIAGLNVEQCLQAAHATVPDSNSRLSSSSARPSAASTSAVWSPSAGAATALGYVPSIASGSPGAR